MERFRDTMKKNYYTIWKIFSNFYLKLDYKPNNWEDRLILFAGYLADKECKSSTIKSYVSAIKAVVMNEGIHINENRFLLNSITRACSFRNDIAKTKLPIHKNLLGILLKQLEKCYACQPYLRSLFMALFSTAYFGLFRIGELTKGDHPILAKDVHIGANKNKLMIILWTSKTHWKNVKPQIVKINSITANHATSKKNCHCPFELLKDFAVRRKSFKSTAEQFFVFHDRSPVTSVIFNRVLTKTVVACGFKAELYSGTSFRAGRALDLFEIGISVETIKKLGRWKSNAIYRYFK